MNARKSKQLRKKARQLQVDWLNSLLPDGESVTLETLAKAMPDQKYFMQGRTLKLSFMSYKWVEKQVKRNPNITLKELLSYGQ
jgi:hypothetical protein